jgi:hypothetical protein
MLSDSDFVLHLQRRGDKKIMLVADNNRYLEPGDSSEQKLLDESTSSSVIQVFDVAVELKDDGKLLVDLGGWLNSDPLQVSQALGKYGMNKDLTVFTKIQDFAQRGDRPDAVLLGQRRRRQPHRPTTAATVRVHHSLRPPEDGYKPRQYDQRGLLLHRAQEPDGPDEQGQRVPLHLALAPAEEGPDG